MQVPIYKYPHQKKCFDKLWMFIFIKLMGGNDIVLVNILPMLAGLIPFYLFVYLHSLNNQKSKSSRKTSISALLTKPKPLTMWITTNCGKFWKQWEYQTTWPASWETCMQVRKQQLELDMEQQTGSK